MPAVGRNHQSAREVGFALALSLLFLGVLFGAGATPARAGCLEPEFEEINFGAHPDFSITEHGNRLVSMCPEEEEIVIINVEPKEDSANLHPSIFDECQLGFGVTFEFGGECSIPFTFEPTEARPYTAKYVIEWEQVFTGIKEKETIKLSGTGRRAFQASSSPVALSGSQTNTHMFTVDGQNVSCTTATFTKNSLATPANEVPGVVAAYKECSAFGFKANVTMGTCTYNFDTPNNGLTGTIDVVCTSNTNVNGNATNNGDARINANVLGSECEVHVESQNNKGTLTYENNKPVAGDLLIKAAVNALTAEKTKDNGLCPLSGTGTVNNATYNGDTGITGNGTITISVA